MMCMRYLVVLVFLSFMWVYWLWLRLTTNEPLSSMMLGWFPFFIVYLLIFWVNL